MKKEKSLIPTHSNTDVTRNEILNDLKNFEEDNKGIAKLKFPDLSNIEEDGNNIINKVNIKNDYDRSKAIDDIKKKYNIKSNTIENNDLDDINLDDDIEDKLRKEQEELLRKEKEDRERLEKELEEEKKFFEEHENILKG